MSTHILVVDDDLFGREMAGKLLRADGFRISEAINGEEALRKVTLDRPDIILMDMSLPVLDGWKATRLLKADPSSRAIPIIALTAHAMRGDREKAMEAGCDDYISKPLDYNVLRARIDRLISTPIL